MQPITTSIISTQLRPPAEKKFNAQAALSRGNLAYLRKARPVQDIRINDNAEAPTAKLERLLARDWRFRRSWQRTDRTARQMTSSAHERVLALSANRDGWSDQEIADMITAARRNHGQPVDNRQALAGDVRQLLEFTHKQVAREQALMEVSRQFAGVFLGQFLQAMRKTVKTGEFGFGGREEQTFQSMLDDEFANQAARSETYGLSQLIYQSLARAGNVPGSAAGALSARQVSAAYTSTGFTAGTGAVRRKA